MLSPSGGGKLTFPAIHGDFILQEGRYERNGKTHPVN